MGGVDELQGCDCAANWLILANSDANFVISEISVNQVRKWGYGGRGVGVLYNSGTSVEVLQLQEVSAHFSQFHVGPVSSL